MLYQNTQYQYTLCDISLIPFFNYLSMMVIIDIQFVTVSLESLHYLCQFILGRARHSS